MIVKLFDLIDKTMCKLGLHNWEDDQKVFIIRGNQALFSESCTNCSQKSLLRCSHFGWAGKDVKRELVSDYTGLEEHSCQ